MNLQKYCLMHILLIKDNCVFINHLQWYWIRSQVFDWFLRLIFIKVFCFLCYRNSAYSGFIGSTRLFFSSHKKTREREWMSKLCQKLRFKVNGSFVKLVDSFLQSPYKYTFCHFFTSHLVILSRLLFYLLYKLVSFIDLSLSEVAFSI